MFLKGFAISIKITLSPLFHMRTTSAYDVARQRFIYAANGFRRLAEETQDGAEKLVFLKSSQETLENLAELVKGQPHQEFYTLKNLAHILIEEARNSTTKDGFQELMIQGLEIAKEAVDAYNGTQKTSQKMDNDYGFFLNFTARVMKDLVDSTPEFFNGKLTRPAENIMNRSIEYDVKGAGLLIEYDPVHAAKTYGIAARKSVDLFVLTGDEHHRKNAFIYYRTLCNIFEPDLAIQRDTKIKFKPSLKMLRVRRMYDASKSTLKNLEQRVIKKGHNVEPQRSYKIRLRR